MGCHLKKNQQQNLIHQRQIVEINNKTSRNFSQHLELRVDFKEIEQFYAYTIKSAYIFNLQQKSYILLVIKELSEIVINDIEANKNIQSDLYHEVKIKGVFTNKKFLYVKCKKFIFQLLLIEEKFIVKKKLRLYNNQYNIQILFLNYSQDIIFEQKKQMIRLKSLKLQKQIFRTMKMAKGSMNYDKLNGFLIFLQKKQGDQFLNIMNIRNRQNIIRQLMFDIHEIIFVQNSDKLLLQINGEGLYLCNINYQNKIIQKQKIIYLNVEQICLFDNNNLLNIITPRLFIKYDKYYNVVQRFNINYDLINNGLLNGLNQVKIKNNLPELFLFQTSKYHNIYKQSQNVIEDSYLKFCECKNYITEYQHYSGRIQHLLSPNQQYLTFILGTSLMFHGIVSGVDAFLHFADLIRFLYFTNDSNSLFVTLDDRILCLKTKQNLKIRNIYNISIERLQTNQTGIIIAIKDSGSVVAINKHTKKMIFKLNTIQYYQSFDYECSKGTILVASEREVSLFNLADRKLIVNYAIRNKQCKLIQNTNQLFVVTKEMQLQLWSYFDIFLQVLDQLIEGDVRIILQGFSNQHCIRLTNKIIMMNQKFQIVEQIEYKTVKGDIDTNYYFEQMTQDDQIIQQNYILRVSIYPQAFIYQDNDGCENIILSLEPR